MPELPEVETVAADLRPLLIGRRLVAAHLLWPRTLAEPDLPALVAGVAGREIVHVGRRGKYLLIALDSGATLIINLRMTGQLTVTTAAGPTPDGAHVRAWFDLEGGGRLVFTDARKFGRIWLVDRIERVVGALGPEPLDWTFTPEILAERIGGRRSAIKALLLDQAVIAGVGNIYADEALFLAGIHPLRPGASLSEDEIGRLHGAIRRVLHDSISQRGTLLRDYRPPYGAGGAYRDRLQVYQHTDEPCPRCGAAIQRIRVTQRSTHFCGRCQPLP